MNNSDYEQPSITRDVPLGSSPSIDRPKKIINVPDGKICDYIDGKFRKDSPEEYVRQTIEKRLVNEHKYEPTQIKIEFSLKLGSRRPRADIAVFPKDSKSLTQDNVWLIIECKSEKINSKDKKEGVGQLKSYMSACPNCEWGMWTNGKYKEVLRKVIEEGKFKFLECNDIPPAEGSLTDIDKPKRNNLRRAYEDNLLMVFKTCHNHIYVTEGLQKQPAFFELLKLIFCKTLDEQNVGKPIEFYTTSQERSNPDGQLTVKNRIAKIFELVKKRFPQIFDKTEEIRLQARSLAWIVSEIQPYSLLETNIDVKGKAYEELVGANLRGDRGEFFTPRNITRMAVEMINPKPHEKICDVACGTGGFLVTAMNHVAEQLKEEVLKDYGKPESEWSDHQKSVFGNKIKEIASSNFFGFDINPDLVKATKMNMVMNNDGSGNIYRNNSLLPPHEWSLTLKSQLAKALNINADRITNSDMIGFFDVIVTNPPFGSKIEIKDTQILEQFDIGHIWRPEQIGTNEVVGWRKSSDIQSSLPPEQLFIERCLQFLRPGGRLAIVLPDSILGNPGLVYIRQWLIEKTKIVASIDLHVDTFQPKNGTQTSVLILQKKTNELIQTERWSNEIKPYNIFMAIVEKVGHDKRGNTIFKRDEYGNEIWETEESNIRMVDKTVAGNVAVQTARKSRIIDDQSHEIPTVFEKWKIQEGLPW